MAETTPHNELFTGNSRESVAGDGVTWAQETMDAFEAACSIYRAQCAVIDAMLPGVMKAKQILELQQERDRQIAAIYSHADLDTEKAVIMPQKPNRRPAVPAVPVEQSTITDGQTSQTFEREVVVMPLPNKDQFFSLAKVGEGGLGKVAFGQGDYHA